MTITLVQSASNSGLSNTASATFGSAVGAGSLIVALVTAPTLVGVAVVTPTDTLSDTYSLGVAGTGAGGIFFNNLYYTKTSGGAAPTVSASTTAVTSWGMIIREYSGIVSATPLDVSATASGTSTTPNSGNASTTKASAVLIGFMSTDSLAATISAGATYGNLITQDVNLTTVYRIAMEDRVVSVTGSYAATFGLTGSQNWGATIVDFGDAMSSKFLTSMGAGT